VAITSSMSIPIQIPYGFQFLGEYSGHSAAVKFVVHNPTLNHCISVDSKSMRLWEEPSGVELKRITFPHTQPDYIIAAAYIPDKSVYVASASDNTFRIYDSALDVVTVGNTGIRAILSLVYNARSRELIAGGINI
jgi:hypothetical protein